MTDMTKQTEALREALTSVPDWASEAKEQPAQQEPVDHRMHELPAGMARYKCACCGDPFLARVADRKRGWAKFCSKSCKAIKQEKRTGQHAAYLSRRDSGLCHPSFEDGEVQ